MKMFQIQSILTSLKFSLNYGCLKETFQFCFLKRDFVDTKPDEFENSLHELMSSIKCQYSIDLPLSTSEENLYTYENIKYSWIDVDPLVSPLGGK